MLQISYLRQHRDDVLRRLAVKRFAEPTLVDEALVVDERRRRLQTDIEGLQAAVNSASEEIGALMRAGQRQQGEEKKAAVAALKEKMAPLQQELQEAEQVLEELLLKLPNLPHTSVPEGAGPQDNELVRQHGALPALPSGALPHWELAKKYRLIDFDQGTVLTGTGFPLYRGAGARLQRALVSFFLDVNTGAGYTEYAPPYLVNAATAYGTGQLPDKEAQMYHVTADDFYLIPTAEVPLTNIHRGRVVPAEELPIRMTAYTPCFRREAGSYGKDVRGLNRVHQFDKVELVQLTEPERSYEALDEMVLHVEGLLQRLELPYRILRLCGGDMSFTSALTYDFEVYSAAQARWLEVSSVSNFESFQTNRMRIRTKADGKTRLLHSLNGSALALPRIVACLLENNQGPEGIRLPEALHPYYGGDSIA